MNPESPSCLLEFRAENVTSFQSEIYVTFSPSIAADELIVRTIPGVAPANKNRLAKSHQVLPVLGLVGANASGKSNVLKAMFNMKNLVLTSFLAPPTNNLQRLPFRGDQTLEYSSYQMDFLRNGIRYVYGFQLTDEAIISEWAFWYPHGIRNRIFERDKQTVLPGSKFVRETNQISEIFLRANALFLSTCAQFDHPGTSEIIAWFRENLEFVTQVNLPLGAQHSISLHQNEQTSARLSQLFRAADFGIREIEIQPETPEQRNQALRFLEAMISSGAIIDGGSTDIPLEKRINRVPDVKFSHQFKSFASTLDISEESQGTLSWWNLVGWILNTLLNGTILLIDELDSSLHPLLVQEAIRLFQNPETNPNGAQMIFNGHSLAILDINRSSLSLRRDQILLIEKNRNGVSTLFPLSDVARLNDEAVLKRYLMGIYGGIPHFSFSDFTLWDSMNSQIDDSLTTHS